MEEIKCAVCQRFIGKEVQGKLYDESNKVIAEGELVGYCVRCRNLVVWRSSGVVTLEEAETPALRAFVPPNPEANMKAMPVEDFLEMQAKTSSPQGEGSFADVAAEPIRLPNRPPIPVNKPVGVPPKQSPQNKPTGQPQQVYVVFGDSKIYHSVDHYEDKEGRVIFDTDGYRLCKICDGFVKAGKVNE